MLNTNLPIDTLMKMEGLTKEAATLQICRDVMANHVPLSVELPMSIDHSQALAEYEDDKKAFWNSPALEMLSDFEPDYYVQQLIEIGRYWDSWNGKPTKYVKSDDIIRLQHKYRVSVAEYQQYLRMSGRERQMVRDTLAFIANQRFDALSGH